MSGELIEKYLWLVQLFTRAGREGLSLDEVLGKWERRYGVPYSRRTFNNHREAISSAFGIGIECNRSTNRYYIPAGSETLDGNASGQWLLNTFTVGNLLTAGKERLSGRISVDNIPSAHRFLVPLMQSMEENRMLSVLYRKYGSRESGRLTLKPYALKESHRRWYLVAWCEERQGMRVYSLDRIVDMEPLEKRFRMPADFDVEECFAHSFGIYLPDKDSRAEVISLKASPREAAYLRDLPLHPSQQMVSEGPDGAEFRLYLIPNDDFIMELCRRGARVEVTSPVWLREAVAEEHRKALGIYTDTQ